MCVHCYYHVRQSWVRNEDQHNTGVIYVLYVTQVNTEYNVELMYDELDQFVASGFSAEPVLSLTRLVVHLFLARAWHYSWPGVYGKYEWSNDVAHNATLKNQIIQEHSYLITQQLEQYKVLL